MRKKLLALMMCATMVLSTATTAMAALTDAEKVYKSSDKTSNAYQVFQEYYSGNETIVSKVYNPVTGKDVEYGYLDADNTVLGEYTPVVVYSKDGDYFQATYVVDEVAGYEIKAVVAGKKGSDLYAAFGTDMKKKIEDGDVVLYSISAATAANKITATSDITANMSVYAAAKGSTKVSFVAKSGADKSIAAVQSEEAVKNALTTFAPVATEDTYTVNVNLVAGGTKLYYGIAAATNTAGTCKGAAEYVTNTKKYIKVNKGGALVEGRDDMFVATNTIVSGAKVFTVMKEATVENSACFTAAFDEDIISKDAVAVYMQNLAQSTLPTESLKLGSKYDTEGKAKKLYEVTKITTGDYTFKADLLSRTKLANAEAIDVFKVSPVADKITTKYGTVNSLVKVATVACDSQSANGTFTFTSNADWSDGVFVFDMGDVADLPTEEATTEEATTVAATEAATEAATTAQASLEKAPQMGDTTPIAALAVVMMGAVGAMVVASKKRA